MTLRTARRRRETATADDPVAIQLRAIARFFRIPQKALARACGVEQTAWHRWQSKGVEITNPSLRVAMDTLVRGLEVEDPNDDSARLWDFVRRKATELPWKEPPHFRVNPVKPAGRPLGLRKAPDGSWTRVAIEPPSAPLPPVAAATQDVVLWLLEDVKAGRLTPVEALGRVLHLTARHAILPYKSADELLGSYQPRHRWTA